MTEDLWWRNLINGLDIRNDLVGEPNLTEEEPKETSPTEPENIADADAAVLRIKLDIYIVSPLGSKQAFMITGKSAMEDAGIMTVRNALKLIERRKKR